MILTHELRTLAQERVMDVEALIDAQRYDGAYYLCGYVIELALKERICKTLHWKGYPNTEKEFQNYKSFKIHDLDILLSLSGIEDKIKGKFLSEWSIVNAWKPEIRYASSSKTDQMAKGMLLAVKTLLNEI